MTNSVSRLCTYMKVRARYEGVAWQLTLAFMQQQFDAGVRSFFGVAVDDDGRLVADDQQPALFQKYHAN